MDALHEEAIEIADRPASPQVKMRMLQQMAEAIDDEATGLCQRLETFDEEESVLLRHVQLRQTEINRFQLRLDALLSERDGILEKIAGLRSEAAQMREEICNNEDDIALAVIKDTPSSQEEYARGSGPVFFQKLRAQGGSVR